MKRTHWDLTGSPGLLPSPPRVSLRVKRSRRGGAGGSGAWASFLTTPPGSGTSACIWVLALSSGTGHGQGRGELCVPGGGAGCPRGALLPWGAQPLPRCRRQEGREHSQAWKDPGPQPTLAEIK